MLIVNDKRTTRVSMTIVEDANIIDFWSAGSSLLQDDGIIVHMR